MPIPQVHALYVTVNAVLKGCNTCYHVAQCGAHFLEEYYNAVNNLL